MSRLGADRVEFLQVAAGGEALVARARDHGALNVGIGGVLRQRGADFVEQRQAERIALVRTVDGESQDGALAIDQQ